MKPTPPKRHRLTASERRARDESIAAVVAEDDRIEAGRRARAIAEFNESIERKTLLGRLRLWWRKRREV